MRQAIDCAPVECHADCLDWLHGIAPNTADAVLTDPPYANVSSEASWVQRGRLGMSREGQFYEAWIREHLAEWSRVLKPTGAIWFTVDWFGAQLVDAACGRLGLRSPAVGIWDRGGLGMGFVLRKTYECFVVIPMEKWERRRADVPDVWRVPWGPADRRRGHAAEKPVDLFSRAVELITSPGDLILDPFAGSGSSAVAALGLGRGWRGCERDADFCKLIQGRLATTGLDLVSPPAEQSALFPIPAK